MHFKSNIYDNQWKSRNSIYAEQSDHLEKSLKVIWPSHYWLKKKTTNSLFPTYPHVQEVLLEGSPHYHIQLTKNRCSCYVNIYTNPISVEIMLIAVTIKKRKRIWLYTYTVPELKLHNLNSKNNKSVLTQQRFPWPSTDWQLLILFAVSCKVLKKIKK